MNGNGESDVAGEPTYKRPTHLIHYGSLSHTADPSSEDVAAAGIARPASDYMQMDEDAADAGEVAEAAREMERRKKARALIIPTDDGDIKRDLRLLGQPICLFGEDPANRRNRLRDIVSRTENGVEVLTALRVQFKKLQAKRDVDKLDVAPENRTWYHEGPVELRTARLDIGRYSLAQAARRVRKLHDDSAISETLRLARQQLDFNKIKQIDVLCSQIADARPISACSFDPSGRHLATGAWSGTCKVWSVPDCAEIAVKRGHGAQVGSVVFKPATEDGVQVYLNDDAGGSLAMASCDQSGAVHLWSWASDVPLTSLPGHEKRVASCQFHPSGRFLATAVYDNSWRMWDVEKQVELLHQEGHSRPVHCVAFHPDGSLLVSGSVDSYARVWDLRTGQCVMMADGHLGAVVDVSCAPNGHRFVTGSVDHSIKMWDLRQRQLEYTFPAHTNVVSGVTHFQSTTLSSTEATTPISATFLVSASYDGTAQVWSTDTRHSLTKLRAHDSRIMSVAVTHGRQSSLPEKTSDGTKKRETNVETMLIATASFDRTFKLWSVVG